MKKFENDGCYIGQTINEKDNVIGSLKRDTVKLYYSNDKLNAQVRELRSKLADEKVCRKKISKELQCIKKTFSWEIGQLITKAFRDPGLRTILLPFQLVKLIWSHLCENNLKKQKVSLGKKNSQQGSTASLTQPSSSPSSAKKFSLRAGITTDNLSSLRIACIMDEFTYKAFSPECRLLQLTPNKWEEEISGFHPDMFFLQSAWAGKDHLWLNKVKYPGQHLKNVVEWCKKNSVPTVFRSTEDPPHFNDFFPAATLCDIVFTTDLNCIKKYKSILQSDRVYLLPFAVQPRRFTPIEKYKRKMAFCFAGAYYPQYAERKENLDFLFETLSTIAEVDVYDRNYNKKDNLLMFPDRFKHRILGDLSYDQIGLAYKGYQFGININSVTQSPTMFARRVYELLASNTVVVSNWSEGVQRLFGDLVISAVDSRKLTRKLEPLVNDVQYYRKFTLLGLRKVLQEHTYEDRLAYMAHKIWDIRYGYRQPSVTVIACVSNDAELDRIVKSYRRQLYSQKRLFVIQRGGGKISHFPDNESVTVLSWKDASTITVGDIATDGFVAGFMDDDYYGSNYLLDILLSTRYSSSPVIGKGAFYRNSTSEFVLEGDTQRYCYINRLPLRCSLFLSVIRKNMTITEFCEALATEYIEGKKCLSIDEFNYCQNHKESSCEAVDDLYLENSGENWLDIMVNTKTE